MTPKSIPIGAPGWDATKPLESFKAFAAAVRAKARQILVSQGYHSEMVFFMPLSGQGEAVPWVGDDREAQAKWMRRHIKDHYAYGVVHVCEGWARFAETGPNDHTLKQVIAGEIRVSELDPDDRREVLTVTVQTRDGYSHTWMDEMVRAAGSDVVCLGACHDYDDFEGRFGKLFG